MHPVFHFVQKDCRERTRDKIQTISPTEHSFVQTRKHTRSANYKSWTTLTYLGFIPVFTPNIIFFMIWVPREGEVYLEKATSHKQTAGF